MLVHACFKLGFLVAACEMLRLCCFALLHRDTFATNLDASAMVKETLASWPEGLVVQVRLSSRQPQKKKRARRDLL